MTLASAAMTVSASPFSAAPAARPEPLRPPSLRNVEFTGPYFHDGSQATLEQVLQFYGRNGDFPTVETWVPESATSASIRTSAPRSSPFSRPSATTAFASKGLRSTILRSAYRMDTSSSLPVNFETDPIQSGSVALDKWALVPEVGKEGSTAPLQTFDELLNGIGNDGTRANTMTTACKP